MTARDRQDDPHEEEHEEHEEHEQTTLQNVLDYAFLPDDVAEELLQGVLPVRLDLQTKSGQVAVGVLVMVAGVMLVVRAYPRPTAIVALSIALASRLSPA